VRKTAMGGARTSRPEIVRISSARRWLIAQPRSKATAIFAPRLAHDQQNIGIGN
jgi:hypothetical protein